MVSKDEQKSSELAEGKAEIPSLGEAFEGLRSLCEEQGYILEVPVRRNRPNAFLDVLEER
ncbi:MAG TPA: hypothetical protein VL025_09440 [Thermoanaerobaculia bacterium]|nr:hypothetical protein [Thermoanaerobaculia bacterium]